MEQDQKLTAWQVVREPSGEIREIKNKCPLSKSRCQDNRQDNQSEATGKLMHFRELRKYMDSPAHTTTGHLNRRVWIQIVSQWRKIERKNRTFRVKELRELCFQQNSIYNTCKVRSSCVIGCICTKFTTSSSYNRATSRCSSLSCFLMQARNDWTLI